MGQCKLQVEYSKARQGKVAKGGAIEAPTHAEVKVGQKRVSLASGE